MISIVIASGKGGVGKTTVATAIARSIALRGIRTGLIDLDVDSPSIPMITGTTGNDIGMGGSLLEPANSNGLKVFSIGHLLPSDDTPILWEGGRKERVLIDIFKSCDFRDVECLVIDLPPGTGDELYGVTKVLQSATAVVVTMPQQLSMISVKKALKALERYNIQVLGIVENMSGLKCSKCGEVMYPFKQGAGKMLADTNGVELLGEIPVMMDISREADEGSVETIVNSTEFKSIADKIIQKLGLFPETFTPIVGEEREKDEGEEIRTEEKEGGKESEVEREGKVTVEKEIKGKRKGVGRITATVKEKEENKLTKKDQDIIKFFIDNKNAPAYQKQISTGANVSEKTLADKHDEGGEIKKFGRLSILVEKGVLECKFGAASTKKVTKIYSLKEDFKKTKTYQEIASQGKEAVKVKVKEEHKEEVKEVKN